MTAEQHEKIRRLARCSFLPGSWAKRFVRDLAGLPFDHPLTERQAANVDRLFHHYRRQVAKMGRMPKFVTPADLGRMGEFPVDEIHRFAILPDGVEVGRTQLGYYASLRSDSPRYLRPGGTWKISTGYVGPGHDDQGYFPDLPTLIDHLYVASLGGPADR